LGGDTFFSIYIKSIVHNVFRVAIIAALMPLVRMIFSISIGELDDHSNIRSIIFLGKAMYFMTSILFFLSGILHSPVLLVITVIFNALAGATLMTSYQSLIRQYGKKENGSTVFGLYFSCFNFAYVIGALLAAILVQYITLPYLYLFIGLFALISFFTDTKLPHLSKKKIKAFLGKESFLHQYFHEICSFIPIKKAFASLKTANKKIYQALGFEFLFNVLNYIGFIFIPIVAIKDNLSLSQIAVIFAIMRLPYVIDFLTGEFADKYSKRRFILIVLLFLSFLFALL
jgi:MFS family permease